MATDKKELDDNDLAIEMHDLIRAEQVRSAYANTATGMSLTAVAAMLVAGILAGVGAITWMLAICFGEKSLRRRAATSRRKPGNWARRHVLGLRAERQARSSASTARYRRRPPWRATSRLTVLVGRPSWSAIWQ